MVSGRFSVLVLGHGEMGRAMERLLRPRHPLDFWEKNLADGTENIVLEQSLAGRDFVLFMLPANPHRELVLRIRDRLPASSLCLSVAKGLDDSGRTPAEVFASSLGPDARFAMLYGPMIAEELLAGRPGFAEVGTARAEDFRRTVELFAGSGLHLRQTDDIAGITWSAVLKNVYVPLLGASEELELGDNVRGLLISEALGEIDRIAQGKGGRAGTAYGAAGLGDLVTTATSGGSLHRRIGRELARGRLDSLRPGSKVHVEGLHTLAIIERLKLLDLDDYPLMRLMRDIVADPRDAGARILAHFEETVA